jgi:TolB-like protein/DNA-binding winged helix-turn-helix (wHTH) protein/tetratricopeptide (TPR) repeat protein
MSLRPRIPRAKPRVRQDMEPPGRRLFAARAVFCIVNAQTRAQGSAGQIDLSREADFSLGAARIHPSTCEVEVAGRREIVQPRAMQVLVALAQAKGAVVSRDRLIELCWEGRVIGDDAINRAIAKVRAAAELSNPPAFEVETIPRVGFRLKVRGPEADVLQPLTEAAAQATDSSPAVPPNRRRLLIAGVAGAAFAALVLVVFLWRGPMQVATPAEASIAVLPFLNMSGDPAKEYFSDGFSEELLNDLANTPQLRVAARTSAFAFKGKRADVQEIANKLHVRTVLEGSVRESGERVRITAQLIDAASGYHLWSRTYDRQLTDILKVQDEIARAIAVALTNKLTGRSLTQNAVDPDAYRKYLLGKFYFDRHTEADDERAIVLFKEVTTLQPDFSDGFAMLGYAYLGRSLDPTRPDHHMAVAVTRAALDRALALNPRNLSALMAYLDLALWGQDWNAAAGLVRRMQRINPNNATVARALGLYYQFLGFPEQARNAFTLATKLDPLSHVAWGSLAIMDSVLGRNDEAIAAGKTALALSPDIADVIGWLCLAYVGRGDIQEAQGLVAKLETTPKGRQLKGCSMEIARTTGDNAKARRIVDDRVRNNQGQPVYMGQNYLEVGEYQKAIPLLRHAYDMEDATLYVLPLDPATPRDFLKSAAWKELTQRPRFRAWQAAHDKLAAELTMQTNAVSRGIRRR